MSKNNNATNINLMYSPSITYEKDFYSDKTIKNEKTYIKENPNKNEDSTLDDLKDIMDDIDMGLAGLPEDIQDVINNVYDPIKDFIEDNEDYLKPEIEDEDEEFDEDDDLIDEDLLDPDDNFVPAVNIIDNDTETLVDIKNKYKTNYTDLFKLYLEKLKEIINRYWLNVGHLLIGKPNEYKIFMLTDLSEEYKTTKDKQHMLDFAMRSQIHRKSKTSFTNKAFPINETLTVLNTLKMSADLMVRYLETDIKDIESELGSLSNDVLEACLRNYSARYDSAYIGAYKYLNSSIELTDNVMQLLYQELKSKQFLK